MFKLQKSTSAKRRVKPRNYFLGHFTVSEPYHKSGLRVQNSVQTGKLKLYRSDWPEVVILVVNGAWWECVPLVQTDPTPLEILVHQCPPDKQREGKVWSSSSLNKQRSCCVKEFIWQISAHWLPFRSGVSLFSWKSHPANRASFSWCTSLAWKTPLTLENTHKHT